MHRKVAQKGGLACAKSRLNGRKRGAVSPADATPDDRALAQWAFRLPDSRMLLTIAIVAITCVVSWMAFKDAKLLDRLLLWPPAIQRKHEYWRLLSYGLVHADFQHLLFLGRAMAWLYAQHLGPLGFLWFYMGGLLVSILPTYVANRHNPNYRSLGASGAVSAVLFAYILISPWSMILVFVIPVPAILYAVAFVAYSIWADRQGNSYINHNAHMWGAAYGIVFTVIMEPRIIPFFLQQLRSPHFGM
jgi:membrane associated rhomboid family serine protease